MKNVKHRLLFPMQAKGNVGKSLEIATRACWLSERGIEWQGFDLDADNRTLSRLFPGEVQLVPMTGRADDQDELVSILKKVTAKPVTIVDARAHLDSVLRTALQATRFFNLAKQLNIGITVAKSSVAGMLARIQPAHGWAGVPGAACPWCAGFQGDASPWADSTRRHAFVSGFQGWKTPAGRTRPE